MILLGLVLGLGVGAIGGFLFASWVILGRGSV